MIRRLVPFPLLSACLLVMWLLLVQSLSPGQILFGGVVSLVATWSMTRLRPAPSRIGKWRSVARLIGLVIADITRSNAAVARIVLSPSGRRESSFLLVPIELKDANALACLALILTATPGSAWLQFNRATGMLLIHVFDLVDQDEWVKLLKSRYETLLKDIFEP